MSHCKHNADTWFDRSVCPEPCGSTHDRCVDCGETVGACPWEESVEQSAREHDATVRAETAAAISRAILAARADDLGDGYTAGARVREQDAAIAREVGGCDPMDEFMPPQTRHGGQERRTGPSAGHHTRDGGSGAQKGAERP